MIIMEQQITFTSETHCIAGLLADQGRDKAVVITHPHPLYGGDMQNPVVGCIQQAYRQNGYTTLRFDFRGVGASEGLYSDGYGEQKDVLAAIAYLADMGISDIDLAGYSFGAWVNAHLKLERAVSRTMLMVSPPVAFMDFGKTGPIDALDFVVTGSKDDIAPPRAVKKMLSIWNAGARLETVAGADHFYSGHLDILAGLISDSLIRESGR